MNKRRNLAGDLATGGLVPAPIDSDFPIQGRRAVPWDLPLDAPPGAGA